MSDNQSSSSLSGLVVAVKESAELSTAEKAHDGIAMLTNEQTAKADTDIKDDSMPATLTTSLKGIFTLAVLFTLYAARSLCIPIVVALLLFFLLSPVVRAMNRKLRVGTGVGAGIVVGTLLIASIYAFYSVVVPASQWLQNAPMTLLKAESKLKLLKEPITRVQEAAGKVQEITKVGEPPSVPQVMVKSEMGMMELWSVGAAYLEQIAIVIILTFFLLASGDMFLKKTMHVLPRVEDKIKAIELARSIESEIGRYLLTISIINASLGIATAIAMYVMDMPTPALWGLMAGLLAFIPYLGAVVSLTVITMVALTTFDTLGQVIWIPAVFIVIDIAVEQFIYPIIVGRKLELNPVVIFVGLAFWGWMWGVVGALIAMPILVVIKIFCDHIDRYVYIGSFLGGVKSADVNPTPKS